MATKSCTFTETAGTTFDAYSVGSETTFTENASISSGEGVITDQNRGRPNSTSTSYYYVDNFTPANNNYSVQIDVHFKAAITDGSTFQLGVGVRGSTSDFGGYVAYIEPVQFENPRIRLVQSGVGNLGSPVTLASTPSVGSTIPLKIEITGGNTPTIKVYWDGVEIISNTPATDIVTSVGVAMITVKGDTGHLSNSTGWHVDNLVVADYSSAATLYTMTGPSTGDVGAASTDFTLTPNGTYTGTITPSDGGNGGTFTPTTRTWTAESGAKTFTYTPASGGVKTISATDDGGLTDPSNLSYTAINTTGSLAVDNDDLWYNGYDGAGNPEQSPFAVLKITTDATVLKVTGNTTFFSSPQFAHLGWRKDGVDQAPMEFPDNGSETFTLNLGSGTKTIELVTGTHSKPVATVLGSFIDSIEIRDYTTYSILAPTVPQWVVYGDSIACGANATNTELAGWTVLLRNTHGHTTLVEAYGFRRLYDDGVDAAARTTFAARLASYAPSKGFWLAIGTNDFGLGGFANAAAFGVAYADFLDKLHAAAPTKRIYCQSPIQRVAPGDSDTGLPAYRTEIQNAAAARAPYCIYVDGFETLVSDANYNPDGVHPNTTGHAEYAASVDAIDPQAVVTYTLRVRAYDAEGSGASASTTFDE